MRDLLGDRIKMYEAVTRSILLPHSITVLRVDGRAFHSYLRNADKPYDFEFMGQMQEVGKALCREVSGTFLAYGQSDEISLLISDLQPQAEPWFGGVVQKMASVAASVATGSLIEHRGWSRGIPAFDARVFTLPSWADAVDYLIWRQQDAVRNSISMAAQAKFSTKQLHGVPSSQMQELLWSHYKITWNDYPEEAKRGWTLVRAVREADVTYIDKRTDETVETTAMRTFWDLITPTFRHGSPLMVGLREQIVPEQRVAPVPSGV